MASPMPTDPAARDRPLRVLRVLTRPNLGGPTRQAIALWHAHARAGEQTLLVTGAVDGDEVALSPAQHGVPRSAADRPTPGWLEVPDLRRGLDPFADWRARRELRRITRGFAPDVVHTHTSKAGLLGRRAAWSEGVPVVAHTFHGHVLHDYFSRLPSLLLRRLERRLAARTDLLFAISGSCADELAACGVAARERLRVTRPAVAVEPALPREQARARLGLPADRWVVAAVGRLVPIKRLHDFVAAVAGAATLHGDVLGDGPLRAELEERARASCGGRLRLLGAEPDAARLLPAYDAVVLPSVREGLPLVAVEAFAAGVPVVGYDVPGVRDALAELGRGLLVPAAEGPAGLRRALERLRGDRELRAAVVADASAAVGACAPDRVAGHLAAAYREALSRRP